MTIELSYITIRIMFQQASIYTALLIDRTMRQAETIDADHNRDIRQIRKGGEQDNSELPLFKIRDLDATAD
jgi:hypothetical protein